MNSDTLKQIYKLIPCLNESELRLVEQAVNERIKLFLREKNIKELKKFSVGERVKFKYQGKKITGQIVKINPKSVSILANDNTNWNVTPNFLRKIK